jgi:hypothetical protein
MTGEMLTRKAVPQLVGNDGCGKEKLKRRVVEISELNPKKELPVS